MTLVIVESPAKAKTINQYLGDRYTVVASFGHVRDLTAKDGGVDVDKDFAMNWTASDNASKSMPAIEKAARISKDIILATDPDREGEAISWHIQQVLESKGLLKGKTLQRVVFHEVTKNAIKKAIDQPRDIDQDLVDAYLARRALDFLVGFGLSPILWRKLPGAKSAGRVQSVALRLISEREDEIEKFKSEEYWSIIADLKTTDGAEFSARLTHLDGKKLEKMSIRSEQDARSAAQKIRSSMLKVSDVESKATRRFPSPPFRTSTLQQEAARKLGFSATRTMRVAQKLYEGVDLAGGRVGLITYMRTDGTSLSADAVTDVRSYIQSNYAPPYLPSTPRIYETKHKNAQESHEAIRPTDVARTPDQLRHVLDDDELKLYRLIWLRTVACQMNPAELNTVSATIVDTVKSAVQLRASGTTVTFDGFLSVYQEDRDDVNKDDDDEASARLPHLKAEQPLSLRNAQTLQHFTEPPPRYSEASLVKKLEELGIGRPSTYASIIQVLQDRSYVKLEQKRFIPEDRGRLVVAFLKNFFAHYVEYDFTAQLENQLDDIAAGDTEWKAVMRQFWNGFHAATEQTKNLTITDVINAVDADLGMHFFPPRADGTDPRQCPSCSNGRLGIKIGKFGAFIGCSNYPECRHTRPLTMDDGKASDSAPVAERVLGIDPVSNLQIVVKQGPYGPYAQWGEGGGKVKPKRVSIPKNHDATTITLDEVLQLAALPREIGVHPETGETISAGIGRFGPYLKVGTRYISLPATDDALTVGMNRAVDIIAQAPPPKAGGRKWGRGRFAKKAEATEASAPAEKSKAPAAKKKTTAKKSAAKQTKGKSA